jgi:hypothetical protein
LAVLYASSPASSAQQLEVMNGEGVKEWGLTVAQEGQYFGLTAQQYGPGSNAPQIGGSDLFFFFQSTPASANQVAVVSRTGTLIGLGTAPAVNPSANGMGPFQVSPSGAEWAWTTDETPNASGKHQGVVEVGGLGEANRVVYRWVAPAGFTEELVDGPVPASSCNESRRAIRSSVAATVFRGPPGLQSTQALTRSLNSSASRTHTRMPAAV